MVNVKNVKYKNDNTSYQLTEELKLILAIIRENATKEKLERWENRNINWKTFIQLALHHRVYPYVYWKLNMMKLNWIPNSVIDILYKRYQQNVFFMLQLTAEMEAVGKLLTTNDIQALFLKGPILASDLYGDLSLRTSKDLDILISSHNIKGTDEILSKYGYIKIEEDSILNEDRWRTHHSLYIHPKTKFSIEVHWRLNDKPDKEPDFNLLWKRRKISTIMGQTINILGEEDLLLYLISHGARHGWFRLRWLLDIDRIIQREVKWEKINQIIKQYSNEHLVGQSLILANRLLDTPISKEISSLLIDKSYKLADAATVFIQGSDIDQPFPEVLKPLLRSYTWNLQKNLIQRIKYFFVLAYPSYKDFQVLKLPTKMHFLYFPLRPFLFAGRKLKILKVNEN